MFWPWGCEVWFNAALYDSVAADNSSEGNVSKRTSTRGGLDGRGKTLDSQGKIRYDRHPAVRVEVTSPPSKGVQ
ncbi:uncharacterized protein EI90DRAFT_3044081 [Cantharellus anzutake]|uniref:uncharacterized protein n=1 Tax=Cantharellus anzutake TaxID=1750568 RepID=UPI0019071814|nr:uncharacterized protein EI90DRAFT_3044081 [Cantharellus anzutake]KAF8336909.1 hypothetical protein EI90DRAFT_3044081 [Cantharellus anzutake]